jgi:hypothetical protein
MKPINLAPFCGHNDLRSWMNAPIVLEGWTVATNGHLMIAVPSGVEFTPEPATAPKVPEGVKFRDLIDAASANAQDGDAARVRAIDLLADLRPCVRCNGSGVVHEVDCDECEGGYFNHGSHEYECKECQGSGVRDADESDHAKPCPSCRATGRNRFTNTPGVGTDRLSVAAVYTALLAEHLPDAEITVLPDENKKWFYVRSSSTGAVGVVVPLHGCFP